MAPSALSILTNTFTDPRDRGKAFAVFGAIAGAGASVGLLSLGRPTRPVATIARAKALSPSRLVLCGLGAGDVKIRSWPLAA
jgi:hypothetical protein